MIQQSSLETSEANEFESLRSLGDECALIIYFIHLRLCSFDSIVY